MGKLNSFGTYTLLPIMLAYVCDPSKSRKYLLIGCYTKENSSANMKSKNFKQAWPGIYMSSSLTLLERKQWKQDDNEQERSDLPDLLTDLC